MKLISLYIIRDIQEVKQQLRTPSLQAWEFQIVDKVIENDLWQSWSKSIDSARMVASNLRGGYNDGSKQVILNQNAIGIDLIKLLRIIKKINLSEKYYKIVCRLLSNYSGEMEVVSRLYDNYEIVE